MAKCSSPPSGFLAIDSQSESGESPMPGSFYSDSILGRLEHHAGAYPEQTVYTFLRDQGDPETLTFGELTRRVRSIAARLRERFKPGDRAVLLYPQGLEFIGSYLGCLAAGVVAVPAY